MNQQIRHNLGIATQSGNVVVCHGGVNCPLVSKPESAMQQAFYESTGVWCPVGARDAFEWLMRERGLTAREIAIAWRGTAIKWDGKVEALRDSRLPGETLIERVSIALAVCFAVLSMLGVLVSRPAGIVDGLQQVGTLAASLGYGWFVWRYLFLPRAIAARVLCALDEAPAVCAQNAS